MLVFRLRGVARSWVMAILLLVAGAPAMAETYAATAGNYTVFTNFTAPCGLGACANYLNTMNASGTFTTAAPLAANLAAQPIRPLMTAFRFSDGLTIYDSSDPNVRVRRANVSTNAAGVVIAADFLIQRWQTGGVHVPGDRLDQVRVADGSTVGLHNLSCNAVVPVVVDPDACFSNALDASTSRGDGPGALFALVVPAAASVATVPTLSTWALLVLAGVMVLAATRSRSLRATVS